MGTCPTDVFGNYDGLSTTYSPSADSSSSADSCCGSSNDYDDYTINGLEIYVPAELINDFKTTWADGAFANNIYPLPDEDENEEAANSD